MSWPPFIVSGEKQTFQKVICLPLRQASNSGEVNYHLEEPALGGGEPLAASLVSPLAVKGREGDCLVPECTEVGQLRNRL